MDSRIRVVFEEEEALEREREQSVWETLNTIGRMTGE